MTAETDICAGCDDPIGDFIGIFFWIAVFILLAFLLIIMPLFSMACNSGNFEGRICDCFEQPTKEINNVD